MWFIILLYFIIFYYILLYSIIFYYILLYVIIFYYMLLYFIIFYYILLVSHSRAARSLPRKILNWNSCPVAAVHCIHECWPDSPQDSWRSASLKFCLFCMLCFAPSLKTFRCEFCDGCCSSRMLYEVPLPRLIDRKVFRRMWGSEKQPPLNLRGLEETR